MSSRRYPLEPLLQAMGMTLSQAAGPLNLNGRYYKKYREEGVTRETAERMAHKAGFHPYEIVEWDMARHDIEQDEMECSADDCTATFLPKPNQRFCSYRCARRMRQRRYRAAHPEQQEKDRVRARRYHVETPKYQRLRRTRRRDLQEQEVQGLREGRRAAERRDPTQEEAA